jgi:hypothetical protein
MRRLLWPKLLFLLAVILAAGAYVLKSYPVLTLNCVRVVGSERVTGAEFGVAAGENLLNIDTGALLDSLLSVPGVERAKAAFNLSGDLVLTIVDKQPLCYLYSDSLLAVSADCELLPVSSEMSASLPLLRGVQLEDVELFEPVDNATLHAAVDLVRLLVAANQGIVEQVSEIVAGKEGLVLILEPGTVVAQFGWGDYVKKVYMLEVILAGNKNPALQLDLRFSDMVILKSGCSDREVNYGV